MTSAKSELSLLAVTKSIEFISLKYTGEDQLVQASPIESQRSVLHRVLVFQRDQYLLDPRRLQTNGVNGNEVVKGLIDDQVIRELGRELEASVNTNLDEDTVSERRDDGIRHRTHNWGRNGCHTTLEKKLVIC